MILVVLCHGDKMNQRTSHKFLSAIVIFLFSLAIFTPYAYSGNHKNFLWRVRSETSTVYLLGSIHFMKKEAYPLSAVIENTFDRSGIIAVEADINKVGSGVIEKLRLAGFYQDNDSIVNHISAETYEYIKKEAERLGFPVAFVNKQKPWFLGMTMSSMEIMKASYNPNYGIDKYFLSKAQGRKKIVELESIDYQISLLAGLPDDEQELFLIYAVKDLKSLVRQIDGVVEAWRSGDASAIASIMERSIADDDRLKAIHGKIMTDRNRNMVKKISLFLQSEGDVFVIVGAGHLVGDLGIVELLKKEGYTVEQL